MKIADFGICAKVQTGEQAETFIGTAMYMSPERMQTESYGKDSDIWSLGMMLLECLSGEHPLQVY